MEKNIIVNSCILTYMACHTLIFGIKSRNRFGHQRSCRGFSHTDCMMTRYLVRIVFSIDCIGVGHTKRYNNSRK
jgi:hypothetical protein